MGLQTSLWRGCPIRRSPDHSLLAAPRGLSQPSTSFIGSRCQGIHRAPFLARRLDLSNSTKPAGSTSSPTCTALSPCRAGPRARGLLVCLFLSSLLALHTATSPAPVSGRAGRRCLLNYSVFVKVRRVAESLGTRSSRLHTGLLPGPGPAATTASPAVFPRFSVFSKVRAARAQKWARRPSSPRGREGRSSIRLCDWRLLVADGRSFLLSGVPAARSRRRAPRGPSIYQLGRRACNPPAPPVRASLRGVEPRGFEPLTSAVQRRRSPS